jgi:hypothetical protein
MNSYCLPFRRDTSSAHIIHDVQSFWEKENEARIYQAVINVFGKLPKCKLMRRGKGNRWRGLYMSRNWRINQPSDAAEWWGHKWTVMMMSFVRICS